MSSSEHTDWEQWTREWQALEPGPPTPLALSARTEKDHRRTRRIHSLEWLLVATVIGTVVLAVAHASAADDVLRGAIVVALVLVIAIVRVLARADPVVTARMTRAFLEHSLRRNKQRAHALVSAWSLIALYLVFLVPWWIDGLRIHGNAWGVLAVVSAWLPLAFVVVIVIWTVHVWRKVHEQIARLMQLLESLKESR